MFTIGDILFHYWPFILFGAAAVLYFKDNKGGGSGGGGTGYNGPSSMQ